ncbi:MAG: hypothetical protein V2A62_05255 [Candidatus Woesearchaeota archaeon]
MTIDSKVNTGRLSSTVIVGLVVLTMGGIAAASVLSYESSCRKVKEQSFEFQLSTYQENCSKGDAFACINYARLYTCNPD